MVTMKTTPVTYRDIYGLSSILTPLELYKFLQIKHIIPESGSFEEYQNKLSDFVTDASEYQKEI